MPEEGGASHISSPLSATSDYVKNIERIDENVREHSRILETELEHAIHQRDSYHQSKEYLVARTKRARRALLRAKERNVDIKVAAKIAMSRHDEQIKLSLLSGKIKEPTDKFLQSLTLKPMVLKGINVTANQASCKDALRAFNFEDSYDCFWCPISQRTSYREWAGTAGNIVSTMISEAALDAMFNDKHNNPMTVNNCLPMYYSLEKAWRVGQVLFQPIQNTMPTDYKLLILDRSLSKRVCNLDSFDRNPKWRKFDGRILNFRTNIRPKAQYMSFNYLLKLLHLRAKLKKREGSGWKKGLDKLEAGGNMWTATGKFLSRSFLARLTKLLGDTLPQEAFDAMTFDELEGVDAEYAEKQRRMAEFAAEEVKVVLRLEFELEI